MLRMICPTCQTSRDVPLEPDAAAGDDGCPACGAAMVFADPAAAALTIARAAARPARPAPAWRVIRREVLIGLAWGVALAALVVYPLAVGPAYRGPDGQVYSYPPWVQRDADGSRVYLPGTSALGWGDWLALVAAECGGVVGIAVGAGALVGATKVALRGRRAEV